MSPALTEFEMAIDIVKVGLLPYYRDVKPLQASDMLNEQEIFATTLGYIMGAGYKRVHFPRLLDALDTVMVGLQRSERTNTQDYAICTRIIDTLRRAPLPAEVRNPNAGLTRFTY